MFKFVFLSCVLAAAIAMPLSQYDAEDRDEVERNQNESAQYSFNSHIDDKINDNMITREETRDGGKVSGMYSYSDGFVMRTVFYEADENGYRVVKEDSEDIGDGPQFNPHGQADVESSLAGKYSVKLDTDKDEPHYKDIRE